jgi:hypothetical protein
MEVVDSSFVLAGWYILKVGEDGTGERGVRNSAALLSPPASPMLPSETKRAQPYLTKPLFFLVEPTGIEPVTSTMPL